MFGGAGATRPCHFANLQRPLLDLLSDSLFRDVQAGDGLSTSGRIWGWPQGETANMDQFVPLGRTAVPSRLLKQALLKGKAGSPRCVTWRPEGDRLLVGLASGEVAAYSASTYECDDIKRILAASGEITALAALRGFDRMILGDGAGRIHAVTKSFAPQKSMPIYSQQNAVFAVEPNPFDTAATVAVRAGLPALIDLERFEVTGLLKGLGFETSCLHWHPRRNLVAAGSRTCQLQLWDPLQASESSQLTTPEDVVQSSFAHRGALTAVKWHPFNDFYLASCARDQLVCLWDIRKSNRAVVSWQPVAMWKNELISPISTATAAVTTVSGASITMPGGSGGVALGPSGGIGIAGGGIGGASIPTSRSDGTIAFCPAPTAFAAAAQLLRPPVPLSTLIVDQIKHHHPPRRPLLSQALSSAPINQSGGGDEIKRAATNTTSSCPHCGQSMMDQGFDRGQDFDPTRIYPSCLEWHPSHGGLLAVGDSVGMISFWNGGQRLARCRKWQGGGVRPIDGLAWHPQRNVLAAISGSEMGINGVVTLWQPADPMDSMCDIHTCASSCHYGSQAAGLSGGEEIQKEISISVSPGGAGPWAGAATMNTTVEPSLTFDMSDVLPLSSMCG